MSVEHEDTRPSKRPRTAEEESPQPLTTIPRRDFERNTEFWFDDGSVILVARNTGFRVYRALLTRQSTVFSNMFTSSMPNSEEMFEGCPVVHVSDSAEDMGHLLRVLLPASQRTLFSREFSFSFHQISAIIRLAHKYDIQDVLDQAIASLEDYFTGKFSAWECDDKPVIDITTAMGHPIGVVNLARLVDRPSLLPTALYTCALMGSTVLDGYRRADMSVEHLLPEDLRRCRNRIAKEVNAILSEVFATDPCEQCTSPNGCRCALQSMLEIAIASEDSTSSNILGSWETAIKEWGKQCGLCVLCEQAALDRDTTTRQWLWGELPDIFDIKVDGWPSSGIERQRRWT